MQRLMTLSGLFLTCAIAGCGSDLPTTVPVTGTVLLDGKPVEGATVNFISKNASIVSSGKTDASGKFSVKTLIGSQTIDGAVVDTHSVAVVKAESDGAQEMGDPKEMMAQMTTNPAITSQFKQKHLIPEKYNNPTMSQLTAEVTQAGPNDITLELKSR